MNRQFFSAIALLILSCIVLSGCTSTKQNRADSFTTQNTIKRAEQLKQISRWQVIGKIAFFEENKRNSASLNWLVDEEDNSQVLNLTSYLGINVLQLTSQQGTHHLKFDGKDYQGNDLTALIYSLTGLTLPTNALSYWLKGLAFQPSDHINYGPSNLPLTLTSFYNNKQWQISYSSYEQVKHYILPTKLTVKKDNLLIKIAISHWQHVE
jgi:outer membrane lipoprotein LolB